MPVPTATVTSAAEARTIADSAISSSVLIDRALQCVTAASGDGNYNVKFKFRQQETSARTAVQQGLERVGFTVVANGANAITISW